MVGRGYCRQNKFLKKKLAFVFYRFSAAVKRSRRECFRSLSESNFRQEREKVET